MALVLEGLGWDVGPDDGYRAKLTEPDARRAAEAAAAGRSVSPDAAMRVAAVWACVRLLAETVGTLPLGVYQKDSAGRRRVASDHGLYSIVHDSPNADQSSVEFWEAVVGLVASRGNFYAEKVFFGPNIVSLEIMHGAVSVVRDRSGARIYRWIDLLGRQRDLAEEFVFHVRGFGFGGDVGLSPIAFARRTLNVSIAADDAASTAVRSGIRPAGFLSEPVGGKSTKEQREDMRQLVLDPITGPGGVGRGAVIPAGWTWHDSAGLPPEELQLLETRSFHIEEICRWFRVPPFMIGHTEKSTSWGTGLEQQMIGFLTFALNPYLRRIEQAIKKQLCTPADRAAGVYAEFSLEGLLRADSAGRAALYASAAQNGWMTRNEIRRLENLPEVEGGDVITVQVNLTPLAQLGLDPTADGLKAFRAMFLPDLAMMGPNGGPAVH